MLIQELARAKVNLTLRVFGRRPDGYHELESVVAFARVADILAMDLSQPVGCRLAGPFAAGLDPADNLVTKALDAVAARHPTVRLGGVRLDKRLPVAAGIGGGSADAAAALRLVRRANPEVSQASLFAIAAQIGADVPVCFVDRAAVMVAIGDDVTPLGSMPPLHAVLANPMVPVPSDKTAAVFRQLAAAPFVDEPGDATALVALVRGAKTADDLISLLADNGNDLEVPARAVMPVVGDVLAALGAAIGVRLVRLSGAGPTCFALFDTADAAARAAADLARAYPTWWIEATTLEDRAD